MKLPSTKKDARVFVRMMTSKAAECDIDNQAEYYYRLINQNCSIQKECCIIGAANHVEIWAKESWELWKKKEANPLKKSQKI